MDKNEPRLLTIGIRERAVPSSVSTYATRKVTGIQKTTTGGQVRFRGEVHARGYEVS